MISKTRDKAKNMNEDRDKVSFILLYYFRLFFFEKKKNTGVYLQVICAESKEEKSKAATHAME